MTRYSGINGRWFMAKTTTALASPVASISEINVNMDSERYETTSYGDTNRTYVKGFKNLEITGKGFWDSADDMLFSAADLTDPVECWFYPIYGTDNTKYAYGRGYVSASLTQAATAATATSFTVTASNSWIILL